MRQIRRLLNKQDTRSVDSRSSQGLLLLVGLQDTGMTESGLRGVTYEAQPPRMDLQDARSTPSEIQIRTEEDTRPGNHTIMVRAFAPENGTCYFKALSR